MLHQRCSFHARLDGHVKRFSNDFVAGAVLSSKLAICLQHERNRFLQVFASFIKGAPLRVGPRRFFDVAGPPVAVMLKIPR